MNASKPTQPEVRRARADDAPALLEIMHEIDTFHARALPEVFRDDVPPPRADDLRTEWPGATTLVAEIDGVVAGFVELHVRFARKTFEHRRTVAHVGRLGVAERYRRRGAARALMLAAADWARAAECVEIDLNVYDFNAGALALYESLGYAVRSRRLAASLPPP